MAWTDPAGHVWTTGEAVTAANMNTFIRLNLEATAPDKVTTAGDLVYATAANTLARLAIGTNGQFLRGGAIAPLWSNTLLADMAIGSVADNADLRITDIVGNQGQLRIRHPGQTDANDEWGLTVGSGDTFGIQWWDNSASTAFTSLAIDIKDFILHTGTHTGAGAVVIATDADPGTLAVVTSGTTHLTTGALATGGPAYVEGFYNLALTRVAAGAASDSISVLPRDDGANVSLRFRIGSSEDLIPNAIPNNGDTMTIFGNFWSRFTSANTSTWTIFISATTNGIFTVNDAALFVRSIQYPT